MKMSKRASSMFYILNLPALLTGCEKICLLFVRLPVTLIQQFLNITLPVQNFSA